MFMLLLGHCFSIRLKLYYCVLSITKDKHLIAIREAQRADEALKPYIEFLEEDILPDDQRKAILDYWLLLFTLVNARQRYWWTGMYADIKTWIHSCPECQQCSPNLQAERQGLLMPLVATEHNQIVVVDIKGPMPTTDRGNKLVLTVTDSRSHLNIHSCHDRMKRLTMRYGSIVT
jgi:hypothetical protein